MKLINNLTINIFIIFIIFFTNCVSASNLDPEKILDSVDDIYRSNASHGIITLSVTTVNWQRTLTLEQWSKGEDKSLLKILKPKKEKGLATLRVDKNVWNYMPKVKRVVKIPSSMMSSSLMGSHFTNDDLVKQSRMTEDYTFSITFEGTREGKNIIEIPWKNCMVPSNSYIGNLSTMVTFSSYFLENSLSSSYLIDVFESLGTDMFSIPFLWIAVIFSSIMFSGN